MFVPQPYSCNDPSPPAIHPASNVTGPGNTSRGIQGRTQPAKRKNHTRPLEAWDTVGDRAYLSEPGGRDERLGHQYPLVDAIRRSTLGEEK